MRKHQKIVKRVVWRIAGVLVLIAAWHWVSHISSGLVVAPVGETLSALLRLIGDNAFLRGHFGISLERMLCALALAVCIGLTLGVLAGLSPELRAILEPLRWMLMTVPGVVIVMVFMLWFGMGSIMVITIAATMAAPIIYIHVVDAMLMVDRSLLEMAKVYNFGFRKKLFCIYGMAVAGPFFSALVVAAGNIIRVVVLAEVLGANEGMGYCLSIARTRLDTAELYALALISMSIAGGLEFFLFRPMANKLIRKRQIGSAV